MLFQSLLQTNVIFVNFRSGQFQSFFFLQANAEIVNFVVNGSQQAVVIYKHLSNFVFPNPNNDNNFPNDNMFPNNNDKFPNNHDTI